jgi:hypothetical protein
MADAGGQRRKGRVSKRSEPHLAGVVIGGRLLA